ncbi:MAG: AI-2E family transporter [Bacteroidota bacterium]|nr:AI-2E family transporter [Rhodothermia bacterium]MCS7155076.1 AI-2E family transporter [Bacteroidota bacterium]MDW8138747.1 AI-2E family transporter [Bacteroidota bacterium]MDW8286082.1 AI-2E family transporter [Bacteroidota bacterium]
MAALTGSGPDRWGGVLKGAALLGIGLGLAYLYWTLLLYTAVSALIAYLLHPLVSRIQASGMRRGLAAGLVFAGLLGAFALLMITIVPPVVVQFVDLLNLLSLDTIRRTMQTVEEYIRARLPLEPGFLSEPVVEAFRTLFNRQTVAQAISSAIGVVSNIVTGLLVVPFLVFFFLKDGPYLYRQLLRLVPNAYFEMTVATLYKIRQQMGRYLRGVLLESLIVATLAAILLSLIGLEYALAVGILAGASNTIPYLGPLIGYLVGVAVGVAQTGDLALTLPVLGSLVSVQLFDNTVLQPWIYSRTANLHPVVVLLAIFAAAQVAGIIGMLLAVPTVTIARILWGEIRTNRPQYGVFQRRMLQRVAHEL